MRSIILCYAWVRLAARSASPAVHTAAPSKTMSLIRNCPGNTEMAGLLQEAKTAIEFDERDKVLGEIVPLFLEDVPLTLLFPQVQTYIVNRRVRGLSNHARPNPVWFAEYLWIER